MNTNYHARKSLSRDCYPLRSWALAIPFCPSFLSKPSFLTSFWKQSQIGKVQVAWQIRLREWLNVTATFCPWSHYRKIKDRKCFFIKLQSMSLSIYMPLVMAIYTSDLLHLHWFELHNQNLIQKREAFSTIYRLSWIV
jgi:hypothetical protein